MKFKLTGNYGTFEITKIVEAEDEDEAWEHTGIMIDLMAAGWDVVDAPEGEEWDIEEWPEEET
jgi:hypothetical protein